MNKGVKKIINIAAITEIFIWLFDLLGRVLVLDYPEPFNSFYHDWGSYWTYYSFPRGLFEAISFGKHMLLSTLALFSVIYLITFNKEYINKIKNRGKELLHIRLL